MNARDDALQLKNCGSINTLNTRNQSDKYETLLKTTAVLCIDIVKQLVLKQKLTFYYIAVMVTSPKLKFESSSSSDRSLSSRFKTGTGGAGRLTCGGGGGGGWTGSGGESFTKGLRRETFWNA